MSDFYRAFEERYRGSRTTIRERLRVYLPFVLALHEAGPDRRALDLGCGRGEWLELLRDSRIDARGIDRDEAMLEAARGLGLAVERGDALETLKSVPDASEDLVSAFHLAEHLPFEELQELVAEALRVLKPGGLLVLESPDPENLSVGAASFYLDPTHVRPLPAGLLAFLAEHCGFGRVKILRLQEAPGLAEKSAPTLLEVLRHASADYAIVAQKAGAQERSAAMDPAFEGEYGVTFDVLAARYDAAMEARLRRAEGAAADASARVDQMLRSRSWRWTAPLRWLAGAVQNALGRAPDRAP